MPRRRLPRRRQRLRDATWRTRYVQAANFCLCSLTAEKSVAGFSGRRYCRERTWSATGKGHECLAVAREPQEQSPGFWDLLERSSTQREKARAATRRYNVYTSLYRNVQKCSLAVFFLVCTYLQGVPDHSPLIFITRKYSRTSYSDSSRARIFLHFRLHARKDLRKRGSFWQNLFAIAIHVAS